MTPITEDLLLHACKHRSIRYGGDLPPRGPGLLRRARNYMTGTHRKLAEDKTPSSWSNNVKNLITIAVVLYLVYFLQNVIWQHHKLPPSTIGTIWAWLALLWVLPFPNALLGLIGFVTFTKSKRPVMPVSKLVSFRYVTRGFNDEVIRESIRSVYESMDKKPLFDYVVEIVTETPLELDDLDRDGRLRQIVVPTGWESPKKTLYKARGLLYATLKSGLPDDAWIMHGDEESRITPSLVAGMAQAIAEEEESGELRIGQGVVLYHIDRDHNKMTYIADAVRTAGDYGAFGLQNRLGLALVGFHGSFILVRNDVEKEVSFDLGPEGSVTEDAFWGLQQMERGRRLRFVDGFMVEQAPQTARDLIKQRRRWFNGLWLVAFKAPVKLRWRLLIGWSNLAWGLCWLVVAYTLVNLWVGYTPPPILRLLANLNFTYYISCYIVGTRANLIDRPAGFCGSLKWYLRAILGLPYILIVEAGGILLGILIPDWGFHVIQKNRRQQKAPMQVAPAEAS
jgi:egghead protein (zeste-white 4 protein)